MPAPADLSTLTDLELVAAYNALEVDDPEVDRLANEMEARGIDL